MAMRRHTDQAYLIRLWRDRAETPLRATLTTVATPHVRRHFANLDELLSFLIAQTSLSRPTDSQEVQHMPASEYDHCTPEEVQEEDPNETTLS
jgi:hypothetical protein